MSFTASRSRRLVLALVACLAAAAGGLTMSSAVAAPTGPSSIVVNRVYSGVAAPSGVPTGSQPYVIVKAGDTFSVDVSFADAKGRSTFFNAPTTLHMTASTNGTTVAVDSVDVQVAKGQRTAVLKGSISAATNQVALTVSTVDNPVVTGSSGSSQWFDVLNGYTFVASSAHNAFQSSIGGSIDGTGDCVAATADYPVCGTLILPNGAVSSQVFMSLGPCDSTTYTKCGDRLAGSIVQVLANLTEVTGTHTVTDLYTKTSPATLILSCDTTLCGTGAIQSIPVHFSLSGNGALETAPACPRKGTVGKSQDVCIDYVQSKRDGASDTILYLLFTKDLRGGIG
jgi:hypothetical protein